LLDLIDNGLFMSMDASSLRCVSVSLLMLVNVGDATAVEPDLLFRNPVIFLRPRLKGEFFVASTSDRNEGDSECVGERSET
jgi:hypothetical protein